MQAHIVTFQIKPEYRDAFIKEMREHARVSLETEPGCLRYDVLHDLDDPDSCHVYEVFLDEASFKAHREAPHNLEWREKVWDWRAGEHIRREGVTVFTPDSTWKK